MIWRGWGILVALVVFACSLGMNMLALSLGGKGYWEAHSWPFALSLFVAAAAIFLLDRFWFTGSTRVLVDEATGERVALKAKHDFFFIPMRWWSVICAAIAAFLLIADISPGKF